MCGIFGFAIKKNSKLISNQQIGMLTYLLSLLNDKRGGDSWGYVGITNDQQMNIERGLGDLSDVPFKLLGYRKLMAHTRFSTKGAKTVENAHPFEIGNIIGAHNGMIYNHEQLNKTYNRECTVDSQHLFHHINEARNFDDLNGYGAIEWFQGRDPSSVYLCQLHNGDLSIYGIGTNKGQVDGVVWSSDYRHLEMALKLCGLKNKTFRYSIQQGQVYYANENGLFYDKDRIYTLNKDFKFSYGNTPKRWENWKHDDYGEYGSGTFTYAGGAKSGAGEDKTKPPTKEETIVVGTDSGSVKESNVVDLRERGNWDWQEWNQYCMGDYTGKKSIEEEDDETESMLRLFQG